MADLIDDFIGELTKTIELNYQKIEKEGELGYELYFSEDLQVTLSYFDYKINFNSPLVPLEITKESREDSLIYLLVRSLYYIGSGHGPIALDKTGKLITLSWTLDCNNVNYLQLKSHLEDFLNYVSFWKDHLIKLNNNTINR